MAIPQGAHATPKWDVVTDDGSLVLHLALGRPIPPKGDADHDSNRRDLGAVVHLGGGCGDGQDGLKEVVAKSRGLDDFDCTRVFLEEEEEDNHVDQEENSQGGGKGEGEEEDRVGSEGNDEETIEPLQEIKEA